MKGFSNRVEADRTSQPDRLADWERVFINSVGTAIEFWGFKWNHGRAWALLYLRAVPMSASELQAVLGLSKGAASMITRELEQWGTVHRVRGSVDGTWRFSAKTELMEMIAKVIRERESKLAERILEDLATAKEIGMKSGQLSADTLQRVRKMEKAALLLKTSMGLFLKTSKLDFSRVAYVLRGGRT